MSQLATLERPTWKREAVGGQSQFAVAAVTLAVAAALLAGWAPLGFSIVIVFLFAGPHNWIEFRYFLGRMPGRWGPLRNYFLFSFAGILLLTASFALLPWMTQHWAWDRSTAIALWNTAFLGWLVALIQWRSTQRPRRDWFWTLPVACVLLAINWLRPLLWDLSLVYLHPLVALWILDRELKRSRPEWRAAYHLCLLCVPVLLTALWWRLAGAPPLPGNDALSMRIAHDAGAGLVEGVSSQLLVATHTFLSMLHYGVWVIAIPLVGLKTAPWRIKSIPMTWRSPRWRIGLGIALVIAGGVVLLLWAGFLADYPLTRDIYFTVALAHVLAEAPFLLRAL